MKTDIFVFGSNLGGKHAGGAARFAVENHGAIWGQGIGLQGSSYALPTMDENFSTLQLDAIRQHCVDFIEFAKSHDDLTFCVTPVGCGIAGYQQSQIRPFFNDMPSNCRLAETWEATTAEPA